MKALEGTRYSLFEAVTGFLEAQRNATQFEVRTVEEVVAGLVADRKAANVSGYHLKDLEVRLENFAKAFNCPIGTVTPAMSEGRHLPPPSRQSVARAELTDATVTVTNLGDQGVGAVFGVIFPPQVAIAGFGRVIERTWVVDGAVTVLPVMTATLAADHRVSDGHRGGLFLAALRDLLQAPDELAGGTP